MYLNIARWSVLVLTFLAVAQFDALAQTSLVSTGAVWKYLDDGSDQTTVWRAPSFNDSSWAAGPAQLGYGDGNEATTNSFGPDPSNKYVTTYYRHSFNVANPAAITNLLLRLLRDDGGVVYLNGTEVLRDNLPGGDIFFNTFASTTVEDAFVVTNVSPSLLVSGANVLAVEMHQSVTNSSDLSFDLELTGNYIPSPPTISFVTPTNTQVIASANVALQVAVSDPDSIITNVAFFSGSVKIGEDNSAPFSFVWIGVSPGNYSLTAEATDSTGLKASSPVVAITVQAPPQGTLIAQSATWKYLVTPAAANPSWIEASFDDSSWPAGPAELGYGDGGEATVIGFGPDANNKYPTTYFRRKFTVNDPGLYGSLTMTTAYDDGVVIYLNGREIHRIGMPGGPISYSTFASGAAEYTPETVSLAPTNLIAGENIMAVEVHQGNATSSDLSFSLELVGLIPPSVAIVSPANGASLTAPVNFNLVADATDDGPIVSVEFYDGLVLLGVATNSPYSIVVTNLAEGEHTLSARATDNTGLATTSDPITINVTDPNPPSLLGATANSNTVTVVFSKALVQPSATAIANYSISPHISIFSAQYGASSNVVELTTALLTPGVTYTLTVNNVRDRAGSTILPNSQTTFEVIAYENQDIGNPAVAGSLSPVADGYSYSGGGTNLGGTSDQFAFAQAERVGDFDLQARIADLTLTDVWSKAGLMARESLAPNSRHASVVATPGPAGSFFQYRMTTGGNSTNVGSLPVNYPNSYVRLQRQGDVFTGYGSWDGQVWTRLGSITLNGAPQTLYVGMLLVSGTTAPVSAQFRGVRDAVGGTFAAFTAPIEPPGPSTRRTGLVITEIMYKPAPRLDGKVLDFVEIYNSNPYWEDLTGYRISGDIDFKFPPGTIMQGGSYLVVAKNPADLQSEHAGLQNVLGPYTNNLPVAGTVRLRTHTDAILLEVPYSNDPPWPVGADGTGHSLVLTRPSYGERNAEAWGISDRLGGSPGKQDGYTADRLRNVVINEFLANSADPVVDYIELYNHSTEPVSVAGCTLSDDKNDNKYHIPAGATIPARGFVAFHQNDLGFGLNSGGEAIYFKAPDGRLMDVIKFEAQGLGVSSGRHPDGAESIYPFRNLTPGAANGPTLTHDIVINEIMYQPITGGNDDEYVELYNIGTNAVDLSGWRFTSGIDFTFPPDTILESSNYLVVARNAARLLSNYPNLNIGNTVGNFSGALANSGERLALGMPDLAYSTNSQGVVTTNVVYVTVDEVTYGVGGHWGQWHKEGGSSLELVDPRADNRLAYNWTDSDETSKSQWTTVSAIGQMQHGSGAASHIEILTMGEGEYLVDDIEVLNAAQINSLTTANSTLNSDMGNWVGRGTHIRSRWVEEGGFNDSGCLHVRASARGDTIANRAVCPISAPSGTVTIRAKVRWLKGWPEILLRLHGNYFEAFGRLDIPKNLGTPGMANSRRTGNAGPAISEVVHSPVLPAADEAAVVTARIADVDGVGSASLFYRIDPASSYTEVAMLDNGVGGDAVPGDGIFSATIPGQPAGTLVAFYVQAADLPGAANTLPRGASPTSLECLVRFGEPYLASSFGTYRQWFTEASVNTWFNRPALSNERIPGTFIYGNVRVIYNHTAKYSSSPYHQGQHSSPVSGSVHYAIEMPVDDQCLGTDNWNKVHAPGNSAFDENTNQREQIGYWFARKMGLPWNYRRYVNMFVNGVKKGTSSQIMEDTERGGDDFVDSRFPDDTDGNLFKLQPWFEVNDGQVTGGTALGFVNAGWCTLNRYMTAGNPSAHFTARYRHNYLVRAANQTANDFSHVFALVEAANTPTNNWEVHTAAIENVADIEEWMRIAAVCHSVGDWDHFTTQNAQNMYGYKPQNGKWTLMIWDFNILLGNSGSWAPGDNLFNTTDGDQAMAQLYSGDAAGVNGTPLHASNPKFRRAYLRGLKEMAGVHMQANSVEPVIDARQAAFIASGVNVPPANVTTLKNWIRDARNSILTQVATQDTNLFALTVATVIDTTNNIVTISGVAPVEMHSLYVNGVRYDPAWGNVRNWTLRVPVTDPSTVLNLEGYDIHGNALENFNATVTVNYNGPTPIAQDNVVINEIMYNPVTPETSFVEIYNRSALFGFDLSGWKLDGVDYTFPAGAVLAPGQFFLIAKNSGEFVKAYGASIPILGTYNGQLDDGGETLTLIKPGPTSRQDVVIDRVRYDDDAPWPLNADGSGPSLQVIDPEQDNSRVSNWGAGGTWRQLTRTGSISTATNLLIWLTTPGDVYIDDVTLTMTSGGTNVISNGDFESDLAGTWVVPANMAASETTTTVSRSGLRSLHLISSTSGGQLSTSLQNRFPGRIVPNATYTLSLWWYASSNAHTLQMRSLPGNNLTTNVFTDIILSSPGTENTLVSPMPAYDPLWINEVQGINQTGIADSAGDRDPWIELYNSGTNVIALGGYSLSTSFGNLVEWTFPAGASINPGEFKVIWADAETGETSGAELHTSFSLAAPAGHVTLSRLINGKPQIVDYLHYERQQAGRSYGDFPDGQVFDRQFFVQPTPGAANISRDVDVYINEWMASNTSTESDPADGDFDDWIELYNAGTTAVDLSGCYLSDNTNNHTQFRIPNGTAIPGGGYLLVWADGEPGQNDTNRADIHASFSLARGGESIGLYGPNGNTVIDEVTFGAQTNNISQGRYPDAGPGPFPFMTTPTPRAANQLDGTGENRPPTLAAVAEKRVVLGETLTFAVTATDPDAGQTLSYNLSGAPAGATIGLTSGIFQWAPTPAQSPNTYNFSVNVSDNGVPSLSATQPVTVHVANPPSVTITRSGGNISLAFSTIQGRQYLVEYKAQLSDPEWQPLTHRTATGSTMDIPDTIGTESQRFYRILLIPQE